MRPRKMNGQLPVVLPDDDVGILRIEKLEDVCYGELSKAKSTSQKMLVVDELRKLHDARQKLRERGRSSEDSIPRVEWERAREAIIFALEPYPEARDAVLQALAVDVAPPGLSKALS